MKTKKSNLHKTPESHDDTYPSSSASESETEGPKKYVHPHRRYTLNLFADVFVPRRSPR